MAYEMLLDAAREMIDAALHDMAHVEYAVEPSRPGFGDASSNVAFLMAGQMRSPPYEVASKIAQVCKPIDCVKRVEAHPSGYLNIWADWDKISGRIITSCMDSRYGGGFGGLVSVLEHTSVNPNKALHIGHVRNVVIGDTISRILHKAGDCVTVLNYVDDSGLQVADVVLGLTRFGYGMEPPPGKKFDAYCGDVVYVETTRRIDADPSLKESSRNILADIEQGDTEAAKLASEVTRRVLADQLETCWRLGVRYDILNYESQIVRSGLWRTVFERLKAIGSATLALEGENAGCWIIQDKVIVRSNGTATYMAKDIPYAAWKMGLVEDPFSYAKYGVQADGTTLYESMLEGGISIERKAADRVITVIDTRQADLQKIISNIMKLFGGAEYTHLGYEAVTLSAATARMLGVYTKTDSQMSGRRGIYVGADHLYHKLVERAAEETSKRNPNMGENAVCEIAHLVAVGAIRYEMIRQDLGRAIVFDMERATRLEGDTASYLQYSHARARRILEKATSEPDYNGDMSILSSKKERTLLRLLGMYNIVMKDAYRNLSPKVVAHYCYDLAVAFNTFYESCKVIGSADAENARLCMTGAFCSVISDALGVLGIRAPSRM